ncbi:glycosyltransferase [Streptomyces sp. LP05-1]|uniref:Glycosyltransferase n=1 Tax=Streptomyces pyxinae TaxID=2970734 RepID=A0ABT2CHX6_9ACTN|nr:glycosyltransferase [Streptomyces sp. LP05-1]MCS0637018.1 glycosyltransferase [Streptomyces sp. LP05-1]
MSALVWIVLFSAVAWLWLLFGHGFFWRTDQRLPPRADPPRWPRVAVVVPARDEAAVLPVSLPSLLAQEYPGEAEIVLVDDGSTDGTGELARALAAHHGGLPLTVVSPGAPEPGWTGKLWAVRHGIALARSRDGAGRKPEDAERHDAGRQPAAAGRRPETAGQRREAVVREPGTTGRESGGAGRGPEFLLLTDADIAHAPGSLRELVAAATTGGFDLVSQMARLRVATGWERLVVPAFVYFFGTLYPFRWVNSGRWGTAAAAGGCVLLRTALVDRARVPESIRQSVIDDVALARAVRRAGGRVWLGLADRVESVRPCPRLGDLWRMVTRSAYAQLRHSPALLVGTVAGLAVVYLAPPVAVGAALFALVAGAGSAGWPVAGAGVLGAVVWAVMAGTYLPMLRYYRQPLPLAPLLPFTALLYLAMTVDSAVRHHRGRGAAWKGRTYPRPSTAPEG